LISSLALTKAASSYRLTGTLGCVAIERRHDVDYDDDDSKYDEGKYDDDDMMKE